MFMFVLPEQTVRDLKVKCSDNVTDVKCIPSGIILFPSLFSVNLSPKRRTSCYVVLCYLRGMCRVQDLLT